MSIVVAASADASGRAAIEHGARMAEQEGVRLVLVNATRGDTYYDPRFAADDLVEETRQRLEERGIELAIRHDVVPDVADAVLAAAEEEGATMIVVGIRRRSPVGKLIMGSVAQRILLDARCPVLAVKPTEG